MTSGTSSFKVRLTCSIGLVWGIVFATILAKFYSYNLSPLSTFILSLTFGFQLALIFLSSYILGNLNMYEAILKKSNYSKGGKKK